MSAGERVCTCAHFRELLGIKLAAGIVNDRGARSENEFNLSMDAWLQQTLARLGAVSKGSGVAAMNSVDGHWWDSTVRIPDWRFVRRRNMVTGTRIHPWRIEQGQHGPIAALDECNGAPPLALRNPAGFEGHAFRNALTLEIEVGDRVAETFPFPREGDRIVTQDDFPNIIAVIRKENADEFGEAADRP